MPEDNSFRVRGLNRLAKGLGAPLGAGAHADSADAIVVLGARLYADGTPTPSLAERLETALILWERSVADVVVVTGGGMGPVSEAAAMRQYLVHRGVPEERLVVERRARNTRENAMHCVPLLLPGSRRVVVVSQPFHLRRASYWFRRAGFQVTACHHPNSLQFTDPGRALKWIAREYLAWAKLAAIEVRTLRNSRVK